jgi:hypothetical protein
VTDTIRVHLKVKLLASIRAPLPTTWLSYKVAKKPPVFLFNKGIAPAAADFIKSAAGRAD